MNRTLVGAVMCALLLFSSAARSSSTAAAAVLSPADIAFDEVASGFSQPVFVTHAGDGSGRLFIVEKGGKIWIHQNGTALQDPFLDIGPLLNLQGPERGLLSLAFHPDYETNGKFYVIYTDSGGDVALAQYLVSGDPDIADATSALILLTVEHSAHNNHNGGTLAFGPDGYLYWSVGDGGAGGDPNEYAQDLTTMLGKVLRIDVDNPDTGLAYGVPATNPFFDAIDLAVKKEIWAYGLRNPWRMSFDSLTGDLYIGDVGQAAREEIDFQPASSEGGENYGWDVMEGSICHEPASGCDTSAKVLPVAEYVHCTGCAVTGGYVYRGLLYPPLQGYYFYGDYGSGRVYSLIEDPADTWTAVQIADTTYNISSFGEGEDGELYLVDYAGGRVYHVIDSTIDPYPPGDITDLSAEQGAVAGNVKLAWTAPPDDAGDNGSGPADEYLLRYSESPIVLESDFDAAEEVLDGVPAPAAPGSPQVMTVSGLEFGTLYYFAIRAQDEYPNASANFATSSATTGWPEMAQPNLVEPAHKLITNNTNPAFDWSPVLHADHYELEVATDVGFAVPVVQEDVSTLPHLAGPFVDGLYYWRVRALNGNNEAGPWSPVRYFTVDTDGPSGPALSAPPNGSTRRRTPTFRWGGVAGAVLYQLEIDNDPDVLSPLYTRTLQTTGRRPFALRPGVYYWRVRARDAAGNWGDWSTIYSVTIG